MLAIRGDPSRYDSEKKLSQQLKRLNQVAVLQCLGQSKNFDV